jgi:hypothetical protein
MTHYRKRNPFSESDEPEIKSIVKRKKGPFSEDSDEEIFIRKRANSFHSKIPEQLHLDLDDALEYAKIELELGPQLDYIHDITTPEWRALEKWTGSSSDTINKYVKHRKHLDHWDTRQYFGKPKLEYRQITNLINKLFRDVPPTTVELTTYRGIGDLEEAEFIHEHEVISPLNRFSSTSIQYDSTIKFAKDIKENIIRVIIPVGSHVLPLFNWHSHAPDVAIYSTEYEILLHYAGSLTKIDYPSDPYGIITYVYQNPSEYIVYSDSELADLTKAHGDKKKSIKKGKKNKKKSKKYKRK